MQTHRDQPALPILACTRFLSVWRSSVPMLWRGMGVALQDCRVASCWILVRARQKRRQDEEAVEEKTGRVCGGGADGLRSSCFLDPCPS